MDGPRHPLADSVLRVERARRHLDDLKREIGAYADRHRIRVDYDPEWGCHVAYRPDIDERPGYRIGVIAGDFVHSARSALDYLTWQLAILHLGREPTEKEASSIQFPITRDPVDFGNSRVLGFVSKEVGEEMRKHQPPPEPPPEPPPLSYMEAVAQSLRDPPQRPTRHPLALLRWLSVRDKHRVLTPIGVGIIYNHDWRYRVPIGVQIERRERFHRNSGDFLADMEAGDRLRARWPTGLEMLYVEPAERAADTEINVDHHLPVQVSLSGPGENITVGELETMLELVQRIVGDFMRFF